MGLWLVCGLAPACGPAPGPDPNTDYLFGAADSLPENAVRYFSDALALVCRDADGYYALNALCSHQSCNLGTMVGGCGIEPDNLAAGFDCCCHGSFFDATGAVISGPANRGLTPWLVKIDSDGNLFVRLHVVARDTRV